MAKRGSGSDGFQYVYWLLVLPLLVVLALCYAVPMARIAWLSVSIPDLGWGNYEKALASPLVQGMLWTTLRLCILTTAISVALAYFVTYVMIHAGPLQRSLMFLCILVPFWVSALLRGFSWLVILDGNGLANSLLESLGLGAWRVEMVGEESGVLVGLVHFMVPFAVLPIFANMKTIDPRLLRAASSLGASPWMTFRRVFLPLSAPGVVSASILVFIFSLGFFITPSVLGRGRTLMIAEFIETRVLQLGDWGLGAAVGMLLLIAVLALLGALGTRIDFGRMFGMQR